MYKITQSDLSRDLAALDNQAPLDENPLPKNKPQTHLVIAPKGSGKSSMIINILSSPNGYLKHFDNIFLVSPTARSDSKFDKLVDELEAEGHYFDAASPEVVTKIVNQIREFNEDFDQKKNKRKPRNLIIFDDVMADLVKKGKESAPLSKLITNCRHLHTSLIFSIQRFKGATPLLRSNSDLLSIFRVNNAKELKNVLEEWSVPKEMYNIGTSEPYSFLHMSFSSGKPIYFKKFSRIEEVDDEEEK